MGVTAARLRGYQPQPAGAGQGVEQVAGLLGIAPASKGVLPNVQ